MPWADAEAILLFVSSDKLQWLPAGERLAEIMPAQAGRVVEQVDRAIEATEFVVRLYPSPDGRYVVFFAASAPPRDEIARAYVWSPHLDQPPRVIVAEVDWSLKFFGWRPHTRQVVWGGEDIWLLDVETGERTSLIAQPKEWADLPYAPIIDGLAISPDGRRMIVSFSLSGIDSGWEVWSANIDGTDARQLFTARGPVYHLTWSPDGKWVSSIGPNGFEVMSPDGEGRRAFGTVPIGGLAPTWSPDSRYLAFTAVNSRPSEPSHDVPPDFGFDFSPYTVRIADVLTGEERDLVEDAIGGEIGARWSPDGKQVVFLSDRSGATEVWVADVDGANLRQVTFDGQPKRTTPVWISIPRRGE
jgi:TolB protein